MIRDIRIRECYEKLFEIPFEEQAIYVHKRGGTGHLAHVCHPAGRLCMAAVQHRFVAQECRPDLPDGRSGRVLLLASGSR